MKWFVKRIFINNSSNGKFKWTDSLQLSVRIRTCLKTRKSCSQLNKNDTNVSIQEKNNSDFQQAGELKFAFWLHYSARKSSHLFALRKVWKLWLNKATSLRPSLKIIYYWIFDLLITIILISDQRSISSYSIDTFSSRYVLRIKKSSTTAYCFDLRNNIKRVR